MVRTEHNENALFWGASAQPFMEPRAWGAGHPAPPPGVPAQPLTVGTGASGEAAPLGEAGVPGGEADLAGV